MSNQEIIKPVVFPPQPVIYKIEKDDGSKQYCSEFRGKYSSLHVQEADLIDYLDMIFDHFYRITRMFDDDFHGREAFILETLLRHFKNHIKSLDFFIRQNVGKIRIETIDDKIVGVSLQPIDKK